MTTNENPTGQNLSKLNENLARIEELSQRMIAALAKKPPADPNLQAPNHELFAKAAATYMNEMMTNPSKIIEHQVSYWEKR